MKKKLLVILIAASMIICALPLSASAEGSYRIKVGGEGVSVGNTYTSESAGMSGVITRGTVEIKKISDDEISITLTDATIVVSANESGIDTDYPTVNVVSAGVSNTIEFVGSGTNAGIYSEDTLNISGSAPLYINEQAGQTEVGSDGGIYADVLNVNGANITIDKADKAQMKNGGIISKNDVNFNGAAVVTLNTAKAIQGVYAAHDINFNLTKGGKVTAMSSGEKKGAVQTGLITTITLADNNVITTPTNGVVQVNVDGSVAYIAATDKSDAATVAVVEYVEPAKEEAKAAGANTGDSNDIALFALMGIMALAGAGIVGFKKREN